MCDYSKLTPEFAEYLRRCRELQESKAWRRTAASSGGLEFDAGEGDLKAATNTPPKEADAPKSGLRMELVEGVCDGCGRGIKHESGDLDKHPALYKFYTGDGRYIQVCWACFRHMSTTVSFAYGE